MERNPNKTWSDQTNPIHGRLDTPFIHYFSSSERLVSNIHHYLQWSRLNGSPPPTKSRIWGCAQIEAWDQKWLRLLWKHLSLGYLNWDTLWKKGFLSFDLELGLRWIITQHMRSLHKWRIWQWWFWAVPQYHSHPQYEQELAAGSPNHQHIDCLISCSTKPVEFLTTNVPRHPKSFPTTNSSVMLRLILQFALGKFG